MTNYFIINVLIYFWGNKMCFICKETHSPYYYHYHFYLIEKNWIKKQIPENIAKKLIQNQSFSFSRGLNENDKLNLLDDSSRKTTLAKIIGIKPHQSNIESCKK